MAVLPVRIFPDPVLKEKAAPVEGVTAEVAAFIDDLLETMRCSPGAWESPPRRSGCRGAS